MKSLKTKVLAVDVLAKVIDLDEASIKERLDTILKIHDIENKKVLDWRQKARCKWVLEGIKIHGLVNMSIKSSRINGLNINEVWNTNPSIIKKWGL